MAVLHVFFNDITASDGFLDTSLMAYGCSERAPVGLPHLDRVHSQSELLRPGPWRGSASTAGISTGFSRLRRFRGASLAFGPRKPSRLKTEN